MKTLHNQARTMEVVDISEQQLQYEVNAASLVEVVPKILDVVCRITGMRFAALARVTDSRWIACTVHDQIDFGMEKGDELKIAETFCTTVHKSDEPVIIDDVPNDSTYCKHPIPAQYGFKSYISMPIKLPNGEFFGTLCALDPEPLKINSPEIIGMFDMFIELIGLHVFAALQLEKAEDSLLREKQTAALREQFIAVLGHDLRTPLGAIQGSAEILGKLETNPKSLSFISVIQDSCKRMGALIEDVLDFARGRLGEGIDLNCKFEQNLENAINQVIEEIKVTNPTCDFKVMHSIQSDVWCDQGRLLQIVSNLVSNAVSYGDNDQPIIIQTETTQEQFSFKVTNYGPKIPEEKMPFLFNPFCRDDKSRNGLGLGLYISSEIAKAHKGTLVATSTDEKTYFGLSIPYKARTIT